MTILLTTHSPHIVSVAPLRPIACSGKTEDGASSEAASTARLELAPAVVADLERYLDVTRGEVLFAKGVLLVEGEAERFLLPALAKAEGVDFDELGISVCSVAGTNFAPYVTLLGERGLRLPVAVVTDGDPTDENTKRGETRIVELLTTVAQPAELAGQNAAQQLVMAADRGFFLGASYVRGRFVPVRRARGNRRHARGARSGQYGESKGRSLAGEPSHA